MPLKRSWADFKSLSLLVACLTASCDAHHEAFREQIFAFGTRVELQIFEGEPEQVSNAVARIEARYKEVDRDWYPWAKPWDLESAADPGELRRINEALAAGQSIDVSPDLANLIRRAAEIERRSLGRFNPGIGRLTQLWGFDNIVREDWSPPLTAAINEIVAATPGSAHLQWDENTLSSRSTVTQLDLGGIAKGAILALTVTLLQEAGLAHAIVDIGGDLTVLGNIHGRAARIGIRSPIADEPLGWLEVSGGETVVTSGDYERYFEFQGQKYQHILDPASGFPIRHTASVTVIHQDPVLADAAATALMVAGMAEFDQTCVALGIRQAILIDASGELRLTAGMDRRVNWVR